jgi:Secretion system C-terminal sorting domain
MKNIIIKILLISLCLDCFSQKEILIKGVIKGINNPCTTDPCLPGVIMGIRTDSIDYIMKVANFWIWEDSIKIDGTCFHYGDSIVARGIDSVKYDLNKDKYYEFSLTNLLTSICVYNYNKIRLYPIPVTGNLFIDSYNEIIAKIQIFDYFGRLLYINTNLNSKTTNIDLCNISSGSYIVVITLNDKRAIIRKIIK